MASHHGSTPAAWATVGICLLGFLVGGLGLVLGSWPAFWTGVGLAFVSGIVGKAMQSMGMGAR